MGDTPEVDINAPKPMEERFWLFYVVGMLDCALVAFMIPLLKLYAPKVSHFTVLKTYLFLAILGAIVWCALTFIHNLEDILRSGFINTLLFIPFCYSSWKISSDYLAPAYASPGHPDWVWFAVVGTFVVDRLLNYYVYPPLKYLPPPPEEESTTPKPLSRRPRLQRPSLRGTYRSNIGSVGPSPNNRVQ